MSLTESDPIILDNNCAPSPNYYIDNSVTSEGKACY